MLLCLNKKSSSTQVMASVFSTSEELPVVELSLSEEMAQLAVAYLSSSDAFYRYTSVNPESANIATNCISHVLKRGCFP